MHSFALVALLALAALAAADTNPCHPDKWKNGLGVTCRKVTLPKKLCTKCKLKPPGPGGNFVNCRAIYDLDDPECRKQLRKYAKLNEKCDPVRKRQVQDFSNANNKMGLDYFVYSICEECCDCIPRGATEAQYKSRKAAKTLLRVNRGNCPAHAFYDICKVWPKVKFVSLKGMKDEFFRPEICPLLTQWKNSPAGQNWLLKDFVPLNDNVKAFLSRFMTVAKCSAKRPWKRCVNLESKQNRL